MVPKTMVKNSNWVITFCNCLLRNVNIFNSKIPRTKIGFSKIFISVWCKIWFVGSLETIDVAIDFILPSKYPLDSFVNCKCDSRKERKA